MVISKPMHGYNGVDATYVKFRHDLDVGRVNEGEHCEFIYRRGPLSASKRSAYCAISVCMGDVYSQDTESFVQGHTVSHLDFEVFA